MTDRAPTIRQMAEEALARMWGECSDYCETPEGKMDVEIVAAFGQAVAARERKAIIKRLQAHEEYGRLYSIDEVVAAIRAAAGQDGER